MSLVLGNLLPHFPAVSAGATQSRLMPAHGREVGTSGLVQPSPTFLYGMAAVHPGFCDLPGDGLPTCSALPPAAHPALVSDIPDQQ